MANIKSQKKRIKTNAKHNEINKSFKSKVKTVYNKTLSAINTKSDDAKILVSDFCSLMDKGVNKGIYHSNKAANKKAKIMKRFNNSLEKN